MSKEFYKTLRSGEADVTKWLEKLKDKEINNQIFTSTNQMIIDLDKLVEFIIDRLDNVETAKGLRPLVDNLYYHVGALKGCKK